MKNTRLQKAFNYFPFKSYKKSQIQNRNGRNVADFDRGSSGL